LPFIENLKSLVYRETRLRGDTLQYVPIIGEFKDTRPGKALYEYTFTKDGVDVTTPSFLPDSAYMRKRRDSKGLITWEPEVESVVNVVDGSVRSGSLFINDPANQQAKATLWNNWLSNTFSGFSDPLHTVSTDMGAAITVSLACSRAVQPPETFKKGEKPEEVYYDKRIKAKKRLGENPYSTQGIVATSGHGAFLAGPYEQVLSQWILPRNFNDEGTFFLAMQGLSQENTSVATTANSVGISLATLHASYAAKMVHTRDAEPSDWATFFLDATRRGHAGVLTSLLSGVVGSIFGPTAGKVANTISDMLPI